MQNELLRFWYSDIIIGVENKDSKLLLAFFFVVRSEQLISHLIYMYFIHIFSAQPVSRRV